MRLLKLSISAILFAIDCLMETVYKITGRKQIRPAVVIYYHAVKNEERTLFARQMDVLLRLAKPFPADLGCSPDCAFPQIAVTFDDGFQSVMNNALPELRARQIPTTIFIPTGCLGRQATWLESTDHLDRSETVVTAQFLKSLNDSDFIRIGSHCVSHDNLLDLDEQDAQTEIRLSKMFLEDLLGQEISALSFPYGAFNVNHVNIAREAGYKRVFTILPTLANYSSDFVIGRVKVDPTDWMAEFQLKVMGAYRWLPVAFSLKNKLRRMCLRSI